jgi:hypothetical protein
VTCAMEGNRGIGACRWKGIGFWFNGGRGSAFGLTVFEKTKWF